MASRTSPHHNSTLLLSPSIGRTHRTLAAGDSPSYHHRHLLCWACTRLAPGTGSKENRRRIQTCKGNHRFTGEPLKRWLPDSFHWLTRVRHWPVSYTHLTLPTNREV